MTPEQKRAITSFFKAVERLEDCGVIRSSRYLGDIGEFLCNSAFGTILANQLRQTGHDGMEGSSRVQIKFNNSTAGNNINVGNPNDYDVLVVVIGSRSKLREADHSQNEFRLYRYAADEVKTWKTKSNNYYCAKEKLASCAEKSSLESNVEA
jgi:hypothetical protein